MSVQDSAIELESRLHQMIKEADFVDNPFHLGSALLFGVTLRDHLEMDLLTYETDVYDLFMKKANKIAVSIFDAVAIVTTGWAAPLGENGEVESAPSEHEEKRRVRLAIFSDEQETMSILRFEDQPDEAVSDPGTAQGSLAEALKEFLSEKQN